MTDLPVQALVKYRLEQAAAALRQARLLADATEWSGTVNRGYSAVAPNHSFWPAVRKSVDVVPRNSRCP
ncbi:MAG: hypothetical protein FJ109_05430 [Deltaproteobacteria bacterium]|nr:hypothetical protein [Deltaproteobacteria bacterium]